MLFGAEHSTIYASGLQHPPCAGFVCKSCLGLRTDTLIDPIEYVLQCCARPRTQWSQCRINHSRSTLPLKFDQTLLLFDERVDAGRLAVEVVGDGALRFWIRKIDPKLQEITLADVLH
ncbi:hypothetical protein CG747_23830 [Streptomyces sp. CB02959]|nr:hypothetical protein CG747_23830 [Streptomyces sp. CB02959]